MKVVQVTTQYPPQSGGVESHVAHLAEGLVERGHEVTVHTADARIDGERRDSRNGVRVRRHRAFAPNGAFHVAPGILNAVRQSNADVLHAHNYHSLPLLFAALGAGDTPLVATTHYHGASASQFRDTLLSIYEPIGSLALSRASTVIAVSDWERRQLLQDFDVDARVIPNGLDVNRFANVSPAGRSSKYVLFVGRLERYKGVQHVVRALPRMEYELIIAGTGPYREELETIASNVGVEERVHFLGHVSDESLPDLYASAEAFVTMSSFEAYGMTVSEALTAGTACVVRESGALTEWAERADCIGVSDVSPRTVASAVEEAVTLDAPCTSLPSWNEVVGQVESLYYSLDELQGR